MDAYDTGEACVQTGRSSAWPNLCCVDLCVISSVGFINTCYAGEALLKYIFTFFIPVCGIEYAINCPLRYDELRS